MVLVCPDCSSRFKVKAEALGDKGRLVRCAKCGHKWHATKGELQASGPAPKRAGAGKVAKKVARKAVAKKPAPAKAVSRAVEEEVAAAPPPPPPPPPPPKPEPDEPEEEIAGVADALAHLDEDEEESAPPRPPVPDDDFDGTPPPIPPASQFEPREAPTKFRGPLVSWLALGGFVVLFGGLLVLFAKDLVRAYPPSGAIYRAVGYNIDLLGYGFELPQPVAEAHPDKKPRTLVVKGVVQNTTGDSLTVPLLKGSLRNTEGMDIASWAFKASRDEALPGEAVPYETETSNIPQGATSVSVTFITEEEASEEGLLDGEPMTMEAESMDSGQQETEGE